MLEKRNELGFALGGIAVEIKSRMEKHVTELKRGYEARGFRSDQINFWDTENQNAFQFEANHMVDAGMASRTEFHQPVSLCIEFDHVVYVCDVQTNCLFVSLILTGLCNAFP